MESKFKVGDRVRCVEPAPTFNLTKDKVYTVAKITGDGWNHLKLKEIPEEWAPQRFVIDTPQSLVVIELRNEAKRYDKIAISLFESADLLDSVNCSDDNFSVGDEVICVDPGPRSKLTKGKAYTVVRANLKGFISIRDDSSYNHEYYSSRFKPKSLAAMIRDEAMRYAETAKKLNEAIDLIK